MFFKKQSKAEADIKRLGVTCNLYYHRLRREYFFLIVNPNESQEDYQRRLIDRAGQVDDAQLISRKYK